MDNIEWDGKDLPPVGCKCMATFDYGFNYCEVLIKGYFYGKVWLECLLAPPFDHIAPLDLCDFKLLEPPEEIERDKAIEEIYNLVRKEFQKIDATEDTVAEALYDAGYRKQGEVVSTEAIAAEWLTADEKYLDMFLDGYTITRKTK